MILTTSAQFGRYIRFPSPLSVGQALRDAYTGQIQNLIAESFAGRPVTAKQPGQRITLIGPYLSGFTVKGSVGCFPPD